MTTRNNYLAHPRGPRWLSSPDCNGIPWLGNGRTINGDWSDELNDRRIELIDKDIQGTVTPEERMELAELQRRAVAYRDRVAPLPVEGARRLHAQLVEKKASPGK